MEHTTVKEKIAEKVTHFAKHMVLFLKWMLIAVITGCAVGIISSLFALLLGKVTALRTANSWLIFCLPLAGLLIVFLYRRMLGEDGGTNLVLSTIHAREDLPWVMAPLIFCATLLTHLFGGSAGREGAALQLGGSIGVAMSRALKPHGDNRRIFQLCGMAALFSALFGTPLAATIFVIEIIDIGRINHRALLPCLISALTAKLVAIAIGAPAEAFPLASGLAEATGLTLLQSAGVGLCCGVVAILFCYAMHGAGRYLRKAIPNDFLRIAFGGATVALLAAGFLLTGRVHPAASIACSARPRSLSSP